MVHLAVFNRKRPGETQRMEIADFMNRERVSGRGLCILDESESILAYEYERIAFKGKLGNSTVLLIDKKKVLPAMKLLLKYRKDAGVHSSNRFIFAKPSETAKNITFDAFRCHNQFCEEMNINNRNLGFTKLRKHFATEVAKKGTSQEEEKRVSDYMSHNYAIHKTIYDQSSALIDITRVSKHLEGSAKHEPNSISRRIFEPSSTWKRKKSSDEDESSNDSNHDPTMEEVEECLGKFKKRRLWSNEEKEVARAFFKDEILFDRVLDSYKVKNFKLIYKELFKARPSQMITQWVKREASKESERKRGVIGERPRYSTPEKELLMKTLNRHSLDKSEPSIEELEDLISNNECLKRRSAESISRKYKKMAKTKN